MTVLGDFVVVNTSPAAAMRGEWRSPLFETGGRLTMVERGEELDNAYVMVTLTSSSGDPDVGVEVFVNSHQLPAVIEVKGNSQRTAMSAFPASFLDGTTGKHNRIRLRSQARNHFIVLDVVCHFRQNT